MVDPVRLASAPRTPYSGTGWRQQAPDFNPRSGEGARLNGGRFNPAGSFPVLYLCSTRACAVAELHRIGERHRIGVAHLLPRDLWRYDLHIESCLDLTDPVVLQAIGVEPASLVDQNWTHTQQIGAAAHALGVQAIFSRSVTGVDVIAAVFIENLGLSSLTAELAEHWRTVADLDAGG